MKFNKKLSLMYVPWVWMFLNELCGEETNLKKIIKYAVINGAIKGGK